MLDKAVAAVRADKLKALEMFNSGEGGFKDRDLYVSCANASDRIVTAHPTGKGAQLRDIKDERGFAFGEEIMRTATEGKVSKITYLWPRPGSDKPVEKTSFFTKVGDQICGVGFYKMKWARKLKRYHNRVPARQLLRPTVLSPLVSERVLGRAPLQD